MAVERPLSISLDPAPYDAVSSVSFSPDSDNLLVSTWAGTLTLHDATTGTLRTEARKSRAAILDAAWTSDAGLAAASLDGCVLHASVRDAAVTEWREVGKHDAAARCVVSMSEKSIVSGGWDSHLRVWHLDGDRVADVDAGGKVYGAVKCGEHGLLFITSERHVRLVDMRKPSQFSHDKVPPKLSHQLRGISASPDGKQYVVGSTEGRVAVEYFDNPRESFSFKCHRLEGLAYPVNCITHNEKYGSFATGGGDGHVSFWDGTARKRIAQYSRYPTSIASIDFDAQSHRIAIAVSYTFEEGEKDHPPDDVHVRTLEDSHIATRGSSKNGHAHEENGRPM